ncbi:MAG: DUF4349 domain-containing protein [Saprospiraceae bacterium]
MTRILLFILVSLPFFACSESSHYESPSLTKDQAGYTVAEAIEVEQVNYNDRISANSIEPEAPQKETRKLIRNGSMHCQVSSIDSSRTQLLALLEGYNGYVSSESASSNYRNDLTYTLRVPEAKFDKFILAVEAISTEVLSRNVNVKDVTEQYVDIAARLSTKRALHARYTQLLSRAKNVEEVINVERELSKVLADIESSEARLKSLGDRASYATLQLSFSIEVEPVVQASFFNDLGDSFVSGWRGVKAAILLGATLWPLLLFGCLCFFGLRWAINRRKASRVTT